MATMALSLPLSLSLDLNGNSHRKPMIFSKYRGFPVSLGLFHNSNQIAGGKKTYHLLVSRIGVIFFWNWIGQCFGKQAAMSTRYVLQLGEHLHKFGRIIPWIKTTRLQWWMMFGSFSQKMGECSLTCSKPTVRYGKSHWKSSISGSPWTNPRINPVSHQRFHGDRAVQHADADAQVILRRSGRLSEKNAGFLLKF